MEDDELAAIRQKRLAEMRGKSTASTHDVSQLLGGMGGTPNQQEEEAKKGQMEEQRRSMLFQVLSSAARERLSRISMVKPEKGRAVEDMLLRMFSQGQLRQKVEEKDLIDLLGQINDSTQSSNTGSKIKFQRRKAESDEEEWD